MNRRSFFGLACGGVVAAAVAPFAKPAFATGGPARLGHGYLIGEFAGESILPMPAFEVTGTYEAFFDQNPARALQSIFEEMFGVNEANTAIFDENAAYCDELVEIPA